jgi:ABC-2 type transport system permease protein
VSRALSAELFKLRTTRTNWGVLLGALALVLVISTVAALAGDFSAQDKGIDLLQIAALVQLFALVIGILSVATEYRHGTITPSLLTIPDRTRLILAKLIAALVLGFLLGLVASALCAAITLPIVSSRGVDTGAGSGTVVKEIVGNGVACALFAAIGVGLGALLRNQVGAIIGALGWLFLVEPLLGIIPGFSDVIQKWFPSGLADEVSGTSDLDHPLGQVTAAIVLAAYAAAFLVAGIAMVRRRDVSA